MLHNTLFQDQKLKKKFWGRAVFHNPCSACGASILMPLAVAPSPFKNPATVLAAALTSAPSLGRQLEVAPATVTSAAAAAPAPAVAWAGSQPGGPRQSFKPSQTGSKKYGDAILFGACLTELGKMEGGQSAIGLLMTTFIRQKIQAE